MTDRPSSDPAALARIFLGEAPGVLGVAGIVIVSIGVFLTQASGLPTRPGADGSPTATRARG